MEKLAEKIGILKKPSMFDLSHLLDSNEKTSTRNFHGGSSTSLSPMKMPTNRNSTLDLARVNNNNGNEVEMLGARSIRSRASNLSITFQLP